MYKLFNMGFMLRSTARCELFTALTQEATREEQSWLNLLRC